MMLDAKKDHITTEAFQTGSNARLPTSGAKNAKEHD
jgi:hypothetical protein